MTAELAVGLPVLVFLLVAALTAVSAATAQLRCVDAAREAARAAARGESDAVAVGARSAPDGASVTVAPAGPTVRAVVQAPVRVLGWVLPGGVEGVAVAEREPGEAVAQ